MIYVTGDCHGQYSKFSADQFPAQKEMSKEDYVIICGDFGIWNADPSEIWWLDWLSDKPFTTLFVDGNHENFDRLYSDEFQTVDFHGGKAHQIREHIYHLMRGYVFELQNKKFFAFGGASSHDISDGIIDPNDFKNEKEYVDKVRRFVREAKMFRINHVSWWEQELPSTEEMERGINNLANNDNEVDYIITHCAPLSVAAYMGYQDEDVITRYFDTVANRIRFKKWFFGHYHRDENVLDNYVVLYNDLLRIA